MNPTVLRAQAALLLARKPLRLRRFGWWLDRIAEETELGLWPRAGAVPSPYPVPGTARAYIAAEIEGRAAA